MYRNFTEEFALCIHYIRAIIQCKVLSVTEIDVVQDYTLSAQVLVLNGLNVVGKGLSLFSVVVSIFFFVINIVQHL